MGVNFNRNAPIGVLLWLIIMFLLYSNMGVNQFILLIGVAVIVKIIFMDKSYSFTSIASIIDIFLLYYIFITILNASDILKLIINLFLLPLIVKELVPSSIEAAIYSLHFLKTFLSLTALYGLIEYIMKYNAMVNFVQISALKWIENMNNNPYSYYPSSIYLHYTYFSYIMLLGLCISMVFPHKNKYLNFLYNTLFIVAIYLSQARIVWIAILAVYIVSLLLKSAKNTFSQSSIIFKIISLLTLFSIGIFGGLFETVWNFVQSRFSSLFHYGLLDGSLGQRYGTLSNWGIFFEENLLKGFFGLGSGGTLEYLKDYSYFAGYSTVDSTITVFLVETGVVGVIIFLAGCIYILFNFLKNSDNLFSKFGIMVIVATLVTALTIDFIANIVILYIFYLLLFLSIKFYSIQNLKDEKE